MVYKKYNEASTFINSLIKDSKNFEIMIVPTDKTNGYITMNTKEYKLEIGEYLTKMAHLIDIKNIKCFKLEALLLLEELCLKISKKEYNGML